MFSYSMSGIFVINIAPLIDDDQSGQKILLPITRVSLASIIEVIDNNY